MFDALTTCAQLKLPNHLLKMVRVLFLPLKTGFAHRPQHRLRGMKITMTYILPFNKIRESSFQKRRDIAMGYRFFTHSNTARIANTSAPTGRPALGLEFQAQVSKCAQFIFFETKDCKNKAAVME